MTSTIDSKLQLITALVEGGLEEPPWASFLSALRALTRADFATLHFRPPGRPIEEMINLFSSADSQANLQEIYFQHIYPAPPPFNEQLAEGYAYNKEELLKAEANPESRKISRKLLDAHQVSGFLQIRVQETSGIHAWLGITRQNKAFGEKPKQLLESIAPILKSTLCNYVALEREKFRARTTADATERLRFGWLMLDKTGNVLDSDHQAREILSESKVLYLSAKGKLSMKAHNLNQNLKQAITQVTSNTPQVQALSISRDPWLDMALLPANRSSIAAKIQPDIIAYLHGDSWHIKGRTEQLAKLFSLTKREAQLALAFCRGLTIAEAAKEYKLSIETVRNHSKRIYAKIGARGMPDLIRLITRSMLVI